MVHYFNQHDVEIILDQIRKKLLYKMNNGQLINLELHDKENAIILDLKRKQTLAEKKRLLSDLSGSGLQHEQEVIDDAIEVAYRENEEDREDFDIG